MPGTQSRDLSAGPSSATRSRFDFRQSLETVDLLCSVRIRQVHWLYSILSSKTQILQVEGATEVSPWKDLALGHYSPGLGVCVCVLEMVGLFLPWGLCTDFSFCTRLPFPWNDGGGVAGPSPVLIQELAGMLLP